MSRRVTTNEQLIKMKELYEQGESVKDIVKQLDIDRCSFNYWKKKNFIKSKRTRKRRITIDFDYVEELYKQGYTYREIAKEIGCSLAVLKERRDEIRKDNPTFLLRDNISTVTIKNYYNVKELLEQNYTNNEIAKKLNLSEKTVSSYEKMIHKDNYNDVIIYKLVQQNNSLIEENKILHETVETLKHELEIAYQIDDYDSSSIPALRRRIYDLEETFDAIKQHFNIGLAQMSSVRYTEYEKQESEDV